MFFRIVRSVVCSIVLLTSALALSSCGGKPAKQPDTPADKAMPSEGAGGPEAITPPAPAVDTGSNSDSGNTGDDSGKDTTPTPDPTSDDSSSDGPDAPDAPDAPDDGA